jgi:hypothetical protein
MPEQLHRIALPEVAPLDIVLIATGTVSAKRENNVKDGTPGGRNIPGIP